MHIQATAMDGAHHGFLVEVPEDAQAGMAPELEQTALHVMKLVVPYAPARGELLAKLTA